MYDLLRRSPFSAVLLLSFAVWPGCGSDTPTAVDARLLDAQAVTEAAAKDDGGTKENCSDGKDNDGDQLVDCADADCAQQICRPSAGFCDVEETCEQSKCPADALQPASHVCRASAGDCDVEEKCDGVAAACPADVVASAAKVCRSKNGDCDVEEKCDGKQAACPQDGFLDRVACRTSKGLCDPQESCDGKSADCPADLLAPPKTVCRPQAGDCDVAELCDGSSAACGVDAFKAKATSCRPSVGGCDPAESCDGLTGACPKDAQSCATDQYCAAGKCSAKKAKGLACKTKAECLSNICDDGVCCDRNCAGPCRSCGLAGKKGTCTHHAQYTAPEGACGYYGRYTCNGQGGCENGCKTSDKSCSSKAYCRTSPSGSKTCFLKAANGKVCTGANTCISGNCWRQKQKAAGVCCATACDPNCGDCNSGTCKPEPKGVDGTDGGFYRCNANGIPYSSCTKDAFNCAPECSKNAWCWNGKCGADLAVGAYCLGGCQCKSNTCFITCW